MAKKESKNWIIVGAVIAVILIGGYFVFNKEGGSVDVGTDVAATDVAGVCVAREGVEIGMCCSKLVNNVEVPVDCEEMIEKAPLAQAFFQVGSGSRLANLPSVYFMVRTKNNGNFDTRVRVSSIDVVAVTGGDEEGVRRIKDGLETLKSQGWKPAAKGQTVQFGMGWDDKITLDVPTVYQMTDGTYSVTVSMEAEDPSLVPSPAGQRTIQIIVQQEVISFDVEVEQVA